MWKHPIDDWKNVNFALLLQECSTFGVADCKLSLVVNEGAADRQVAFRSRLTVLQCFRPFSDPVSVDVAAMC